MSDIGFAYKIFFVFHIAPKLAILTLASLRCCQRLRAARRASNPLQFFCMN